MNLLQKVERNHGKHSMKFRFCTRFFVSLILMCGYLGAMAQNTLIPQHFSLTFFISS